MILVEVAVGSGPGRWYKSVMIYPHHCPAVLVILNPGSRLTQKPCRRRGELRGMPVKSQSSGLAAFLPCSLGLFLSLAQSRLWSNAGGLLNLHLRLDSQTSVIGGPLECSSVVLVGAFGIFFSLSCLPSAR